MNLSRSKRISLHPPGETGVVLNTDDCSFVVDVFAEDVRCQTGDELVALVDLELTLDVRVSAPIHRFV